MFAVCFTEGECSFLHQLHWKLSDAFYMHSTPSCGVVSWDADLHPWQRNQKDDTGIRSQGCRKQVLQLSMKQRLQRLVHICYNLVSLRFSSRYMATQIATGEAIGILGNTSRFCFIVVISNYIIYIYIFRIAALAAAYLKKQQAKLQARESNSDVSEPTFWVCVREMPLLDPAI